MNIWLKKNIFLQSPNFWVKYFDTKIPIMARQMKKFYLLPSASLKMHQHDMVSMISAASQIILTLGTRQ